MAYTKAQREAKAQQRQQDAQIAPVAAMPAPAPQAPKKPKSKPQFDLHALIPVINGYQGYMVYVSAQSKEVYEWHEFGDVCHMEIAELLIMKRTQRRFFKENWVLIEDADVLEYLGVDQHYSHSITSENFDQLFALSPEELMMKCATLSDSLKYTIATRAQELINTGEIDSRKKIMALEKALGVTFE